MFVLNVNGSCVADSFETVSLSTTQCVASNLISSSVMGIIKNVTCSNLNASFIVSRTTNVNGNSVDYYDTLLSYKNASFINSLDSLNTSLSTIKSTMEYNSASFQNQLTLVSSSLAGLNNFSVSNLSVSGSLNVSSPINIATFQIPAQGQMGYNTSIAMVTSFSCQSMQNYTLANVTLPPGVFVLRGTVLMSTVPQTGGIRPLLYGAITDGSGNIMVTNIKMEANASAVNQTDIKIYTVQTQSVVYNTNQTSFCLVAQASYTASASMSMLKGSSLECLRIV
jgi:hypothetical protein